MDGTISRSHFPYKGERIVGISYLDLAIALRVHLPDGNKNEPPWKNGYQGDLARAIERKLIKYASSHQEELKKAPRPQNYMVGFHDHRSLIDVRVLKDLNQIVNILGRYKGGLYIPEREISFDLDSPMGKLCFFEKEFGYEPK